MSKVTEKLNALKEQEKKLRALLEKERENKTIKCECGKLHKIKDCAALQAHYYVPPSGCTDGAYWTPTGLSMICPNTDHRNRLLFDSKYDIPWDKRDKYEYNAEHQFELFYGHLFKEIIDDYNKDMRPWTNNYYIDRHHKKFGLCVKGIDEDE